MASLREFLRLLFARRKPPPSDLGRNDRCWCGSGKKYKRCHYEEDRELIASRLAASCKPSG
jgi:hypothetical protein